MCESSKEEQQKIYNHISHLNEIRIFTIKKKSSQLPEEIEMKIYEYDKDYNEYLTEGNYKLLFKQFPKILNNGMWFEKVMKIFTNDDNIWDFIIRAPKKFVTKEIVLKGLKIYPQWYKYIPEYFKYDKGIINFMMTSINRVYKRSPFEVMKLCEEMEMSIYEFDEDYNNYLNTRSYRLLFEKFPFIVRNELWYNKVMKIFTNDNNITHFIRFAPKNFITRKVVLKYLNIRPKCYRFIPEWFKYDKGIINFVLKKDYTVFKYFPNIVKTNWIKEGVKINTNCIKFIDQDSFNTDSFNVVKEILIQNYNNFDKLSLDLQYNSNIIKFVVQLITNKNSKLKISDNILSNKQLVLYFVKEDPMIIKYLDNSLKNDKEIILEAVKRDGNVYKFVSDILKDDMEIVLTSYLNSRNFYHYYSERNKEIIDLHNLSI